MFQREFLGNTANKVRSIALLASHLEAAGCEVHHASADVDRLIVLTASDVADRPTFGISVLIGEDAYLLIMLTVLSDPEKHIHLVSYRPVMEAGKWTPYITPYTQRTCTRDITPPDNVWILCERHPPSVLPITLFRDFGKTRHRILGLSGQQSDILPKHVLKVSACFSKCPGQSVICLH